MMNGQRFLKQKCQTHSYHMPKIPVSALQIRKKGAPSTDGSAFKQAGSPQNRSTRPAHHMEGRHSRATQEKPAQTRRYAV